MHDGAVLVGGALDEELPLGVDREPGPAAAKPAEGRLGELLLELVEAAKHAPHRFAEVAGRFAPLALAERFPEETVVGVAAAVVADGGPDRLGHLLEVGDQLVYWKLGKRIPLQRLVQIRDIGGMVLAVVDLHRAGIDGRLEGVDGIGERGQHEGHGEAPKGMFRGLSGGGERRCRGISRKHPRPRRRHRSRPPESGQMSQRARESGCDGADRWCRRWRWCRRCAWGGPPGGS